MNDRKGRPAETPLRRAFGAARWGFVAIGVFSFFLNLLMLVSPLYMMQVFDRVLASGRTETLIYLTLIAGFALLILGLLEIIRNRVLTRISTWLDRQLSGELIGSAVRSRLGGAPIGAQPLRDLQSLRGFVGGSGVFPLFDSPWVPVFVAVIWLMNPWLGALALGAAVVLFLLALANDLLTRKPLTEASQLSIGAQSRAEAAIRNADVVQAMGLMPGLLRDFDRTNDRALVFQQHAGDRAGTIVGLSKFVRLFVQVGILGLGAYLVLNDRLTAGGMIAASILLGRCLAPVEQAIGAWRQLVGARGAYRRLQALLAAAPGPGVAMPLPAPEGRVDVDRMSFVPPGAAQPVLKQVSFALEPGEALGVIGPSAAGKSTLCRLLVGVWPPTAGAVRLDGAEVHTWDRTQFGAHVGYLPQDVELFAGTVRDNISRLTDAEPAQVIEAAKLADVHEMILHLPKGYDTDIGEAGQVLSGGQRQRIGLARAMFGNPKLVVLDEPNANLDQDGEAALLHAIATLKDRGTTVVMVAHRPSALVHIDRILVLRDGQIEMLGPRDDVLKKVTGPRPARPARGAPSLAEAAESLRRVSGPAERGGSGGKGGAIGPASSEGRTGTSDR